MSQAKQKILERPSCVLLDIDNTVYRYEPAHAAGMKAAHQCAADLLDVSSDEFLKAFRAARAEIKRRVGATAASHHRLLYFQRTVERLGLASQVAVALKVEQAYWTGFLSEAALLPEVHEFLDDLRLFDIPVVVVTDLTAEIQFRKFLLWRLDRYVDWIVTSEEAGADKPAPEIYNLALAKLGGVEGPVWMIGDNGEADMSGAKNALGAVTFQMLHAGDQRSNDADFVISSFSELRAHLRTAIR